MLEKQHQQQNTILSRRQLMNPNPMARARQHSRTRFDYFRDEKLNLTYKKPGLSEEIEFEFDFFLLVIFISRFKQTFFYLLG